MRRSRRRSVSNWSGKIRQEHLYLQSDSGRLCVVHFHCSLFVQIVPPPAPPFLLLPPPLLLFFSFFFFALGVTQEGVYRTVGSNIQVQKLLNAFFGKKISLQACSTSVHSSSAPCSTNRFGNLREVRGFFFFYRESSCRCIVSLCFLFSFFFF